MSKTRLSNKKVVKRNTGSRAFRIAIIPSFTFDGIKKHLQEECATTGLDAKVYIGKYGQHTQEILNDKSGLYEFLPDMVIVAIDTQSFFGADSFSIHNEDDKRRLTLAAHKEREVKELINNLIRLTSAKIVFHNFEVPTYSPIGILENKQRFGAIEMIQATNARLRDLYKDDSRVFIFDYDGFCSRIGKENIADPRMYYLADLKVDFRNLRSLSHEYLSYIKPIVGLSKKCLVLDLDNTLWGGVLGEDGLENIKIGPTPEGSPFLELQKYALNLFNRGVILAINSKNNTEEALSVFREHPHMVLRENHFAAMRINWDNKVSNLKEIAKELNIGIDSLVFVDDDKTNREMVNKLLPQVFVVDLPEDPALYVSALQRVNDFNTLQLTEEDRERGKMYAVQREREELKKSITNIDDFLKSLNLRIYLSGVNRMTLPRVSQLTQKTNQFNLTTRRYSEKQLEKLLQSKNILVKQARVKDKFGDYGITGVVIIKKESTKWAIDTFLLSCRVLGKNVERAFVSKILEDARDEGAKEVVGEFVPTAKNMPAKSFYKDYGFKLTKRTNKYSRWSFDLARQIPASPEYIKVTTV